MTGEPDAPIPALYLDLRAAAELRPADVIVGSLGVGVTSVHGAAPARRSTPGEPDAS